MNWLLDEMLPPVAAAALNQMGHDAVAVIESGLTSAPDGDVYDFAVATARTLVTENFADFARILERRANRGEPCVPVVFVRRAKLAQGGGMAQHLARRLDRWATEHPEPYIGAHWA